MSRLARDGTAERPSRETNFSGANADREIFIFPVQLTTSRIGNLTWLIHTLIIMCVYTYIHTPPVLSTCPFHTNSGGGRGEAKINCSIVTCQGSTRSELP